MTKTALITGGSRGIGKATADILREHGWDVIAPTREELDLSSYDSLKGLIFGWCVDGISHPVDALIFCHGEWYSRPMLEQMPSDWSYQYWSRVIAPFALINFLIHGLPESLPTSVVMVSSTQAFGGTRETAPYSAACAAQIALMKSYSRSYPDVRFNTLACGWTDTDMGRQVKATGGVRNPDALPQSPQSVARVIVGVIEDGISSGRVIRVVDGVACDAEWRW